MADADSRRAQPGYDRRGQVGPSFGIIQIAGVEGTSSYGAGLTRVLQAAAIEEVEVSRPDRAARRRQGKSDPLDVGSIAQAECI